MALLLAVKETDLDEATFPTDCPHSLEQLLQLEDYPAAQNASE
ncbi:DUF29 family protein [uncultured Thiocystis sp.]|jgi:hypothetical protein|nr:DUF29 family protein [uncultured Thiocystis sp.]